MEKDALRVLSSTSKLKETVLALRDAESLLGQPLTRSLAR
jgi:hypothetical protein